MIQDIVSAANPTLKLLRSLHAKKHRLETGLFLAEGARCAIEAAAQGAWPEIVACTAAALERPAVRSLLEEAARRGARIIRTSDALLAQVTRRDNAQTLVGAYRQRWTELAGLADARRYVALEGIRDPGNLGTILRTADAAGAGGVILVQGGCDPFSVEAVRASMGSIFAIPVVRTEVEAFLEWRTKGRITLIGLSLTGSCRMEDLSAAGATCLLMGNEQSGLPAMLEDACDARARLPMAGAADSLNLAIATGVALYGLWRAQGYEGATR